MKRMFGFGSEERCAAYVKDKIENREGRGFSNSDRVYAYLRIVIHYLYLVRPAPERTLDSVLKLMGASFSEKGYRTPFWAIIREASASYPGDEIFFQARLVENDITNEDIDELFDFMEEQLAKQRDRAEAESDLGLLSICRVRYRQSRVRNIRMQRRRKNAERRSVPAHLEACRSFAAEYSPRRIKEYLDRFVIGQEDCKKVLSTAIYNHLLRVLHPEEKLHKTNVLMVGPSGCGKTEMIRRLTDLLPLPVVITDFSGVVATPWRGRNKEEALLNLYLKAGRDKGLTECGIVFCDEFDKIIPMKGYGRNGDINNELQGQLLGMFEGTELEVPLGDRQGGQESISINTGNILFICAGAFEGLDKIVKKDVFRSNIGFSGDVGLDKAFEMKTENLRTKHLIEFGMKPELAGRLSAVSVLKGLDREALKRVLTEPEDSLLSRYQREFSLDEDVKLSFTDEALDVVTERVASMRIGARGLNTVMHEILAQALYDIPSLPGVREVLVTGKAARMEGDPVYIQA